MGYRGAISRQGIGSARAGANRQHVVIRAYKALQDRHKDVILINAWHNLWPQSMMTMQASTLINFQTRDGPYVQAMYRTLADNGIDPQSVITLPVTSHLAMPRIYRNTDVGIFPNRCEGGTNLVLMEYMA